MSQDQTYLWVPISGPGSILSLFASVILKMLRSIQLSPLLTNVLSNGDSLTVKEGVSGLGVSTQHDHLRFSRHVGCRREDVGARRVQMSR